MKKLVLVLMVALAAPLAGYGKDVAGQENLGVVEVNVARRLLTMTSWNGESELQEAGNAFQFHLAPAALFTFDADLNSITGSPIWGYEAGAVYWIFPQLGVGLAGQYFTGSGSGEVDGIKLDADFTYFNVFVNFYSQFVRAENFAVYGLFGLGYSQARLAGEARTFWAQGDFDETDTGVAFLAGIGIQAPWIFGELRYTESSYSAGKNEEGDNVVAVLDGVQVLIGMRTP